MNPKRQTDVHERSDARPVPEIDHLLSQISQETVSSLPEFLLGKNVYAGMPEVAKNEGKYIREVARQAAAEAWSACRIPQEFSQDESKAVFEEEYDEMLGRMKSRISKRPDGGGVQRNARSASPSPERSSYLERCNCLYEDAAHRRARHENSCHKAENEERRMLAAMQKFVKGTLQGPSDSRTHLERVADFVEKKEAARFQKTEALMNERKSLRKAQLQECTFTPKISRASQSPANLWTEQEKAYDEAGLLRDEISMTIHELNTQLENELSKYYQYTDLQQYSDGVEWSRGKEYLKNMVQGPVSSATIYMPKIGIPPYSPSREASARTATPDSSPLSSTSSREFPFVSSHSERSGESTDQFGCPFWP